MTTYAVYQIEDGRLVSSTTDQAKVASSDVLAARGYAVATFADASGVWNPDARAFSPQPAAPKYATSEDIVAAFTPAQWAAAKAVPDVMVTWLLDRLIMRREPVEITGAVFLGGMQLLVAKGVLTADESAAIVASLGG